MRKELKLRLLRVLSRKEVLAAVALAAVLLVKHLHIGVFSNGGECPPEQECDPLF